MRSSTSLVLAAFLLAAVPAASPAADEPLHSAVDRLVEAGLAGVKPAAIAPDDEFVRRVYLDLTGMVPTADQVREFLADERAEKRQLLIDKLLDSASYARRMQYVFDLMLMERRTGSAVKQEEWYEYLRTSFRDRKSYRELVRELLAADGTQEDIRPASRFYLDRGEANLLVRDVGRLFLGIDMQCAQCHDHPSIDDYKQRHYYGLYAYLNRSYAYTNPKTKQTVFAEKFGTAEVAFKSVFFPDDNHQTGARVLEGPLVEEPTFVKGQEYFVAPSKNAAGVPKFSIRSRLAEDLPRGDVPGFAANLVNRMWAMMMGRGLVHPLDLRHSANPPSHPELLELLSQRFVASDFDVQSLLRELALSKTYQRSSVLPAGTTPEQVPPEKFAVAPLKPLTAEQLAWSMLQVSGQVQAHRASMERQLDGDTRMSAILQLDEKRRRKRDELVETYMYSRLASRVNPIISTFGGAPGTVPTEFEATAEEALYLSNTNDIQDYVNRTATLLQPLLSAELDQVGPLADELYLSAYARFPDADERRELLNYLQPIPADGRPAALKEVVWALLVSSEFRFNH